MNNTSHTQMVRSFMLAADQVTEDHKGIKPVLSKEDKATAVLRLKLQIEETFELIEAFVTDSSYKNRFQSILDNLNQELNALQDEEVSINLVEAFDALIDIDYIASGTSVWLDLPYEEGFLAVHENNMTKVDKTTGKVIKNEFGKVLKPKDYIPVDLVQVLAASGK